MNPPPLAYLHFESAVMFLFLGMVIRFQFLRAAAPGYFVQRGRTQLRWLAAAFLVMAVVFSVFLANVSPFLGLEIAAGVTLSLMHPVNALCFTMHLMILRPWDVLSDNPVFMLLPRLTTVLCAFSWLLHPGQHANPPLRNLKGVLFLGFFTVWLFISTIKAADMGGAQTVWFNTYFKALTIFLMTIFLIESDLSVNEAEMTLVISSLALMAMGIYQSFTDTLKNGRFASSGLLGDPNDLASIIVMGLPFALGPAIEKAASLKQRTAGLAHTVLALLAIWITRSRGAMMAMVAQIVVYRAVKSKQPRKTLLILAVIGAVIYTGLTHLIPRDPGEMAASEGSRLSLWESAVYMALHNPLLGVGFNQFPINYGLHPIGTVYEWGPRTAHSSWLLALAESGFPGGFCFVALFVWVVRIAWRDRALRPYQLYSIAGYGIAMSFLSHTYSIYYYFLIGIIIASTSTRERMAYAD